MKILGKEKLFAKLNKEFILIGECEKYIMFLKKHNVKDGKYQVEYNIMKNDTSTIVYNILKIFDMENKEIKSIVVNNEILKRTVHKYKFNDKVTDIIRIETNDSVSVKVCGKMVKEKNNTIQQLDTKSLNNALNILNDIYQENFCNIPENYNALLKPLQDIYNKIRQINKKYNCNIFHLNLDTKIKIAKSKQEFKLKSNLNNFIKEKEEIKYKNINFYTFLNSLDVKNKTYQDIEKYKLYNFLMTSCKGKQGTLLYMNNLLISVIDRPYIISGWDQSDINLLYSYLYQLIESHSKIHTLSNLLRPIIQLVLDQTLYNKINENLKKDNVDLDNLLKNSKQIREYYTRYIDPYIMNVINNLNIN